MARHRKDDEKNVATDEQQTHALSSPMEEDSFWCNHEEGPMLPKNGMEPEEFVFEYCKNIVRTVSFEERTRTCSVHGRLKSRSASIYMLS